MMDFDAYSADYWTRYTIGGGLKIGDEPADNYLRAQIVSSLPMDKDSKEDRNKLMSAGEGMWEEYKEPTQKILRAIIDQKYGPKPAAPAEASA